MEIQSALLCDAATVREGLLHVLGGGVTRVGRPEFPSPLSLTLALLLVGNEEDLGEHLLTVDLYGPDGEKTGGGARVEFDVSNAELEPDEPLSVPLALPFPPVAAVMPRPGAYWLAITLDGGHAMDIHFRATLVAVPLQPTE